ncbi:MAG: hypothetical protein BWY91_01717 [bacterium ADurb.BinA028]|nr:MAG: hypothetical protein BWY91_01717 [bacterium ADurb.BinA028]
MRLAARVIALVAAACGSLAALGMPPASAAATTATTARATTATATVTIPRADPTGDRITLTAVSPAVLRPGDTLLVTGTIDVTSTAADGLPTTVRLVRGRSSLTSRSDVDEWSAATGAVSGTELGRQPLDPAAPRNAIPFQFTVPADQVRPGRAYGVSPIAVDVVTAKGTSVSALRTFVGWQRSADYEALSLAWLLPVTLAPDTALTADDPTARTAAWTKQVGAGSRLAALLRATASQTVGYAVDPAVLGPSGRTPAQDAADPASAVRSAFSMSLSAASATHPVFALPQNDPDLAALTAPDLGPTLSPAASQLLAEAVGQSTRLTDAAVTTRGTLAWPADGALPSGREAALRAAYASRLDAILVSTQVTDPSARLTPPALGVAPLGTTVLRWDDRLGALLARLKTPREAVLAAQEFVAQTAALLAERPSISRTILAVPPRGFDAGLDADLVSTFFDATKQVPWLRTVGADSAMLPGRGLDSAPPLPTDAPASRVTPTDPASAAASNGPAAGRSLLARVFQQRSVIDQLSSVLAQGSPTIAAWSDLPGQAASTRWRTDPAGREALLAGLEQSTATVSNGLMVIPQTTNFLADEGVMQLTVVNSLDEPVRGLRAVLAPGNGRIVVVDPGAPVDIAANAKATVSVRLAVLAQGLVPVNAWLTTADGTRIGAVQQLTIRAAPPGAWLYIGMSVLFGLILIAGIVRAVRRPPRVVVDTRGLDPVDPTPEAPVVAPVQRHTAP